MPLSKLIVGGLNSIEKVVGGILVLVLFFVLLLQTFGRNIGLSTTWTDETSRYLFALLVYVGAGLAMLWGKHIKIDIMITVWPKSIRKYIEFFGVVLGIIFCVFVFYQTLMYNVNVVFSTGRLSPVLLINMGIPYLSVNVGYLLMGVRLFQVEFIPSFNNLFLKKV